MNADQILLKKEIVKNAVIKLKHQLATIDGLGKQPNKALNKFVADFTKDIDSLITEALKPVGPREADIILEQINKTGKLTPELVKEIRRLFKKKT